MSSTEVESGYAPVGGLDMYYEIHGSGPPLVLLHGAYMSIDMMAPLLARLARDRRVIAPELRGHARTADAERPITYERMADDTAALVGHLGLGEADVAGYSMGGGVALQVAIRHPAIVRKLVVVSASYATDGMHAAALEMLPSVTPEMFAGSPFEAEYRRLAPDPDAFAALVEKLTQLDATPFAWPEEAIRAITAPTLLIVGDSDIVRLEHAVALFGLRGGGVMGDLTGIPRSQLAVIPGTSHFMPPGSGMLDRADWLVPMISAFLDAPVTEAEAR